MSFLVVWPYRLPWRGIISFLVGWPCLMPWRGDILSGRMALSATKEGMVSFLVGCPYLITRRR